MALVLKDRPVGVDDSVDIIQKALYSGLVTNGTWTNYESYHRAYRNETNNGIKPEIFSLEGNDYRDVFMSDKFTVTSFFLVGNETEISEDMFTSNISVIFQVDLNKLYFKSPHRFDEEFRNEIVKIFKGLNATFKFDGAVTNIDSVYAGLDTSNIKKDDTHPRHVVRFELTAKYTHACGNVFVTSDCTIKVDSVTTTPESTAGANDGTATANFSGDQGVITFLWTTSDGNIPAGQETNQTATGLDVGSYTVVVSDDNAIACTDSGSGTVAEAPPLPSCGISITNQTVTAPTTQGGSDGIIEITVTGNVGSITYRHDNVIGSNPQGGFSQGDVVVTTADSSVLGCAAGVNVFMPSHYGNYLIFDGRTESVEFDNQIVVANAQDYTVATHVRALHEDFTIMVSGSSTKNRCYIIPDLNQVWIRENSNYLIFDFPSIVKDTWYYVVWGRGSNFTRVWINGVESTSGAIAMSGPGATNFERLGVHAFTFIFDPLHQDNFGIKVGADPASHVAALTADPTTFDTEMSGSDVMFRFNELPASLEAIDESANNNNGTLSGFLANADPANRQPHV